MPGERLLTLELLGRTEEYLRRAGIESARLDAEVLLAHVLGTTRIDLYTRFDRPVDPADLDSYRELVRRRGSREPVAYLVGEKEFYSRALKVTPAVLVPRPETEHLVDEAIALARGIDRPLLLDLGTGSGCIAVAWAAELPEGRFVATDVSEDALAVARENAERHGVADRGTFLAGDLYEPALPSGPFHLVACNPPYVADDEETDPECRAEPAIAVFAGEDPLTVYGRVLAGAPAVLRPGGHLLLELPGARAEEIRDLVPPELPATRIVNDYQGLPRVLIADYGT